MEGVFYTLKGYVSPNLAWNSTMIIIYLLQLA